MLLGGDRRDIPATERPRRFDLPRPLVHGMTAVLPRMRRLTIFRIPVAPHSLDATERPNAVLTRRWKFEAILARARWCTVPICLLLIPLFPSIPWLLLVLIALGFGLGNAVVVWLLGRDISPTRFQWTARLASALDWSGVLGVIGAFSGELEAGSPSLLLLLLGMAGLRWGLRGLIIATTGATVAVVILVEVQVLIHGVLTADRALAILVSWGLLFGVAALLLGSLLRVGEKWWSGQETGYSSEGAVSHEPQPAAMEPLVEQVDQQPAKTTALQRPPCCLTKREQQLLPLLAQPDLTYQDIGDRLSISPDTIKTHVYHMAQKLGVRGRWAVVTVSRKRGLLGDEDGD